MPIGVTSVELLRYFRQPESAFGKSVQRPWTFNALFIYNPFKGLSLGRSIEFPPVLQTFHFVDITIPTYSFNKEILMYGQIPRTFPILNFKGFEVRMTLEEDEQGTVEYFINWNQRNIINKDGTYNAPDNAKIKALAIEIQDKTGIPIVYYIFHDLYFLNADPVTYAYQASDSIKRNVTFGVDRLSTYFTKQNIVSRGLGAITGTIGGIANAIRG